jgi:hypothetical protein
MMTATFQKRQKEMKRMEKRKMKEEKRAQKKLEKNAQKESGGQAEVDVDIAPSSDSVSSEQ